MIYLKYSVSEREQNELPTEEVYAKLARERALHVNAIFRLLSIISIKEHYLNNGSADPNEELRHCLKQIGNLGELISEGLFEEIDGITDIAKKATMFLEKSEVENA